MGGSRGWKVVFAVLAVVLAAAACTNPGGLTPKILGDGSFAYEVSTGGSVVDSGGGPVSFEARDLSSPLLPKCGSWFETGLKCSVSLEVKMATGAGFAGITGTWSLNLRGESNCDLLNPGCGKGVYPVELSLSALTTPDGASGVNATIPGEFIDGTNGCPGKGVHFAGTGPVTGDPSSSAAVDVTFCSAELHAKLKSAAA